MANEMTDTVSVTLAVEDHVSGKHMEQEWEIQVSKISAMSKPKGDKERGNCLVDGQTVLIVKGYYTLYMAYKSRLKLSKFTTHN